MGDEYYTYDRLRRQLENRRSDRLLILMGMERDLQPKAAANIARVVREHTVRRLDFEAHDFPPGVLAYIASAIEETPRVHTLTFNGCRFSRDDWGVFTRLITATTGITTIVVNYIPTVAVNDDPWLTELADAIRANSGLTALSIEPLENWEAFFEALKRHPTLERLCIHSCGIDCTHAELLAGLIRETEKLKELELPDNNIDEAGARKILESLPDNFTLTKVDLRENDIERALFFEIWDLAAAINKRKKERSGRNVKSARKR